MQKTSETGVQWPVSKVLFQSTFRNTLSNREYPPIAGKWKQEQTLERRLLRLAPSFQRHWILYSDRLYTNQRDWYRKRDQRRPLGHFVNQRKWNYKNQPQELRKWDLQRRVKEQLLCKKWELRKYQVHNHTCRGPTEHKSCIFGSKRRRGRTPWWWFRDWQ